MRRIIKNLLRDIGYVEVEEAEDGLIALNKLKLLKYDFVITDINMPNMNGFELLSGIKGIESIKHIPVLMVTAESREEDIIMAAQKGAAGYIVKPFTKSTLEDKVKIILQKNSLATA